MYELSTVTMSYVSYKPDVVVAIPFYWGKVIEMCV